MGLDPSHEQPANMGGGEGGRLSSGNLIESFDEDEQDDTDLLGIEYTMCYSALSMLYSAWYLLFRDRVFLQVSFVRWLRMLPETEPIVSITLTGNPSVQLGHE